MSAPAPDDTGFSIGRAATDTVGGYLPDGKTLSPFDTANPVIAWLDPPLLAAVQESEILADGKTEVFWGHTKSLADAKRKKAAAADASKQRKWQSHAFEIAELEKSFD